VISGIQIMDYEFWMMNYVAGGCQPPNCSGKASFVWRQAGNVGRKSVEVWDSL